MTSNKYCELYYYLFNSYCSLVKITWKFTFPLDNHLIIKYYLYLSNYFNWTYKYIAPLLSCHYSNQYLDSGLNFNFHKFLCVFSSKFDEFYKKLLCGTYSQGDAFLIFAILTHYFPNYLHKLCFYSVTLYLHYLPVILEVEHLFLKMLKN